MQYPIIKVKKLPLRYKHCMIVKAASFNFENIDAFLSSGSNVMKQEYLNQLHNEIFKVIDAQFISAQGEKIQSNGNDFIVFKSNFDLKMFERLVSNLSKEIDEYLEGEVALSYAVIDAMLYLDGRDPTLLGSMRMGKDLFESSEYQKAFKKIDISKVRGHAKYLTSFDEFKLSYVAQADNYCI